MNNIDNSKDATNNKDQKNLTMDININYTDRFIQHQLMLIESDKSQLERLDKKVELLWKQHSKEKDSRKRVLILEKIALTINKTIKPSLSVHHLINDLLNSFPIEQITDNILYSQIISLNETDG